MPPQIVGAVNLDEIAAVVFIDLVVIMVAARLMGRLAKKVGQPAVVGEIVAGIVLGPSLLGAFPGALTTRLFPLEVRPFLKVIAQLGLIIFMFIVGLELDLNLIRGKERTAAVISISSIALPFSLGFALAAGLHSTHGVVRGKSVDFVPFALFIGASMSVTAFPVLARILTERGMFRTGVGTLTLACAAVDDVMAWSLLALVLAVVASVGAWDLPRILAESALFVMAMVLVVRPLVEHLVARRYRQTGQLTPDMMAMVLAGLLIASYVTAKIGIHQIFGAFLFGAILPRVGTERLFREILERLETVSVLLLLPVFFVTTGLDANVRGIGRSGIGQLALILLVACSGKFIGAAVGSRLQGVPTRQAATVGILMNTRGLTELVILNVGLAFGVLDTQLFTMLVVMAIVTTVITVPLLRLSYPDSVLARDVAEAERAAVGAADTYRVLVAVGDPNHAERMVDTAADLIGEERPAEIVLTRFTPRGQALEMGSGLVELAEMAATMDTLKGLAPRVEARGVRCVVLYQFSDDVAADLVTQAKTVGASVLLVGGPRQSTPDGRLTLDMFAERMGLEFGDFIDRVFRTAPCDVVLSVHPHVGNARPTAENPVVVAARGGPHDPAALEFGVRIARARGSEVRVVDGDRRSGRRLEALAQEIRELGPRCTTLVAPSGVVAEIARTAQGVGVVVTGLTEWTGADTLGVEADELVSAVTSSVLIVRADRTVDRPGLGDYFERLFSRIGSAPEPGHAPVTPQTSGGEHPENGSDDAERAQTQRRPEPGD